MMSRRFTRISMTGLVVLFVIVSTARAASQATPSGAPADCFEKQFLPRVARVLDPEGEVVYARVLETIAGRPTRFETLGPQSLPLGEVFERAADATGSGATFTIESADARGRICAPAGLSQNEIDAETRVIVAAGLNYAAHADEIGGGDVFLFPKATSPTGPYGSVHPSADVRLLDYEVELGFVLLETLPAAAPESPEDLASRAAFFVANDVTNRAPLVLEKDFSGPGTGFVDGKSQPTFLPAGPWMVRGTELFAAASACGAPGLGMQLSVDGGDGPEPRQSASTERMLLSPSELLGRIGEQIESTGLRTPMPRRREDHVQYYPFAVGTPPMLPVGSLILTGTPEGIALATPNPAGLVLRGLLRLRGPFAQFHADELARQAAGESHYLNAGDLVRASIDGLGTQEFRIAEFGSAPPVDPCVR